MSQYGNYKALEKRQLYIDTIDKVIVTYKNDYKREFSGADWFLFENDIRKMCKSVEVINK